MIATAFGRASPGDVSQGTARVHEVAGWRIKVYPCGLPNGHRQQLAEALTLAVSMMNLRCTDTRLPVGFCVVASADTDLTEVVVGLWAVSQSVRLALLSIPLGGSAVVKSDLPLECAEVLAFEARSITGAGVDRRRAADVEQDYLSDWYSAGAAQPARSTMRATFLRFALHWRSGDLDGLMADMSDTPSYRTSAGACFEGREAVRKGLAALCKPSNKKPPTSKEVLQDVHFFGNHSLSYWSLALPDSCGSLREVKGVDVITYDADGRVALKDAYRKG